jgi:hypothetical protein
MSYLSVNPAKAAFNFSAHPLDEFDLQQQQHCFRRSTTTSTLSLSTLNVAATTVALLDVVDDLENIFWLIFG